MSRAEIADVYESANSVAFRRKVSLASKHIVNAIISRGVILERYYFSAAGCCDRAKNFRAMQLHLCDWT